MCMNTTDKTTLPYMTLAEITEAAGGTYHGDPALLDQAVTGVTIDSRQATPGCLYVPFKGARVDGHSFIPQVMEAGALCALTEEDLTGDAASATHIRVGSTEKALRDLAAWYRMHLDIPVIGITGSYGKTSAKEMVSAVLGARFNVLKTAGNFNNHIGLPLTIFRIRPEHEAAVLEMGISGFGEMSMLAQIARPDIAMITTIGDCHLEQLGDRAGVYRAKSEMFDYMKDPAGPVILRADDEILGAVSEVNGHAPYFYGMTPEHASRLNDAYVTDVQTHGIDGTDCILHMKDVSVPVHIPVPGTYYLYHMMAGALIGRLLGMSPEEIAAGAGTVRTISGHGNIIRTDQYVILDDCYNANPASMEAALKTLSQTDRRRVAILGDMGELGKNESDLHYNVGLAAGTCAPDLMICVGSLAREIMHGYQDTPDGRIAGEEDRALCYTDKEDLIRDLPQLIRDGDAILVKASHFMGFEKIVESLR